MKLRTRIALIAAVAVAVAVVMASIAAYAAARRELVSQVDESLAERAGLIARVEGIFTVFSDSPGRGRGGPFGGRSFLLGESVFQAGRNDFDVLYLQLVDANGVALPLPDQDVDLPVAAVDVDVARGTVKAVYRSIGADDLHLRMITVPIQDSTNVALQLARPLTEADATLSGLAALLIGVGIVGVALAGGLGLVVATGALGPVERLTAAAEHVAETQDLAGAIEVDRNDEVGRLAESFNAMLAALSESRQQQERLVRDAGHELRTPLTALRTNIELLARARDLPVEDRAQLLEDAMVELEELSDLVEEVVDLAAESRISTEAVVSVRLDELVRRVAERAERRTSVAYQLKLDAVTIAGREAALERAVGNLLDNASKWNAAGEPVDVSLVGGRLSVRDRGPGFGEADLPRVFDRFYRSDAARSMPGSGLGLAIVKRIIGEHGGTVFARNHPGGGAEVGFELPPYAAA